MRSRFRSSMCSAVAVVVGLAWTQLMLVTTAVVLPERVALAPRIAQGAWYRIAEWTVIGPLSAAVRISAVAGERGTLARPTFAAALMCALLATSVGVSIAPLIARGRVPSVARVAVFLVCGVAIVSSFVVAGQVRDAAAAEREYFALASHSEKPWTDAATVARAQRFVRRHPLSRWRSEALRLVAMRETAQGRFGTAEGVWRQFQACFDDPTAPGIAYAEFSRALCFERLGNVDAAVAHHRAAIDVIRARGDGIQGWIAPDAATRIARLERNSGMPVAAAYWTTQSRTLHDVCSIE